MIKLETHRRRLQQIVFLVDRLISLIFGLTGAQPNVL